MVYLFIILFVVYLFIILFVVYLEGNTIVAEFLQLVADLGPPPSLRKPLSTADGCKSHILLLFYHYYYYY